MEKSISASEKSPIEILYMPNPAIEINEIANENMCSLISMHLLNILIFCINTYLVSNCYIYMNKNRIILSVNISELTIIKERKFIDVPINQRRR